MLEPIGKEEFIKLVNESSKDDKIKELYHYTNSDGLMGIINNGEFWATHHKFQKDDTEIKYGIELINNKMLEYIEDESDNTKKSILQEFNTKAFNVAEYSPHIFDYYSVSFSSDNDSLPLWREYGDKGKGYTLCFIIDDFNVESIGLDIVKLANLEISTLLIKVIYKEDEQEKIIRSFYKLIRSDVTENTTVKQLLDNYCKWYYNLPVLYKQPSYDFENEWRIVYKTSQILNDHISFRSKGSDIIPYIKIGFKEERMPKNKITVGYKADYEKAHKVINIMHRQNNLEPPSINHSLIK
ncbi:DUF2971 domain-containing protein [Candidatus Latescibacterota bacterium]